MKNKKTHIWIALGIIAVFLFIAFFGCGSDIKGIRDMRFGIDIKGGVEAVFEPVGITKKPTPQELEAARNIMEGRLDAKKYPGPGSDCGEAGGQDTCQVPLEIR